MNNLRMSDNTGFPKTLHSVYFDILLLIARLLIDRLRCSE